MANKYTPPTGSIDFTCRRLIVLPKSTSVNFIFNHSDTANLGGYVNIVSLVDLPCFIRINQHGTANLLGFTRVASVGYTSLGCIITTASDYVLWQIFTKGNYTYIASQKGTDIVDNTTGLSVYFKETQQIRTVTLWGNDDTLFVGGVNGLYEIDYTVLHSDYVNSTFYKKYTLLGDVTYIHGKDKQLLISTTSGIEYINYTNNPTIKSMCLLNNVGKCYMTNSKAYYIEHNTISGSVIAQINRKDNLLTDWSIHSESYIAGDGILPLNAYLTDIFVTENTAAYGGNTIFCTTTSGVYVIDEDTKEYAAYFIVN